MVEDVVLVVFIFDQAVWGRCHVNLFIIPKFARQPTWGDDVDLLNGARVLLTIRRPFEDLILRPYRRVKRLEASGLTSYLALPRQSPHHRYIDVMDPAVVYTMLCVNMYSIILELPGWQLIKFLWNVRVPETCPECLFENCWALKEPLLVLCYACGCTMPVSACRIVDYLE